MCIRDSIVDVRLNQDMSARQSRGRRRQQWAGPPRIIERLTSRTGLRRGLLLRIHIGNSQQQTNDHQRRKLDMSHHGLPGIGRASAPDVTKIDPYFADNQVN